ncbi:MAG TPA: alpha/beta fold hydrolase [Acidimicrobiales bacterium]|nr:alpha/beta fold hydrolase [Acidimicrobiales bacterium]
MEQFQRGSLVFDVRDRGPEDAAEAVVLLHGFPASAACWDGVVPHLAEAGYRTLAPNQRGFSPGARPSGRTAYRQSERVADVLALADAAGLDRFHLVGHDFGAEVAWGVADQYPDRLLSVTSVSVAHPRAFARAFTRSSQALQSWYMFAVQVPGVPERAFLAGGGRFLRWNLVRSGLAEDVADRYVEHMRQPGALTAALNWYRALRPGDMAGPIEVPTLLVWSTEEVFVNRAGIYDTGRYVTGPYRLEVLEGVSHWVPEEAPDRLAALVLDHVRQHARK